MSSKKEIRWNSGKLKDLFGAGVSSEQTEFAAGRSDVEDSPEPSDPQPAVETKPPLSLKEQGTIKLETVVTLVGVPPLTVAEKRAARDRCVFAFGYDRRGLFYL